MLDMERGAFDYFWCGRLHTLCLLAAEATKTDERRLTPEDIKSLEGAKHYIEIALRNDENNKAEKPA